MSRRLELAVKCFLTLSMLIALITPIYATTLLYALKCESKDYNSTMTHESYLQKVLSENNGGNSFDYLAGSFNYLHNGRIVFKDMIGYREEENPIQGRLRDHKNTLFFHNMNLSFEGAKGISNFFASGSLPDKSRTISSHNGIRFEEFSHNFSPNFINNLGANYSAEMINVNAVAILDNSRKKDFCYNFLYNATVANGVVETKSTIVRPDKTNSLRINQEQTTLMKGNITLDDKLSATGFF